MSSRRRKREGETLALARFDKGLKQLEHTERTAKKHGFNVAAHSFYRGKTLQSIATLHKELNVCKRSLGADPAGIMASHIVDIENLVKQLNLQLSPAEALPLIEKIQFVIESDFAAEWQARQTEGVSATTPFLCEEIVPQGIYRKILQEVNKSFRAECYNGCAGMVRRLVESLIVDAFEAHRIEDKIKSDGEYQELKALIGKAIAEPALKLSRNTKAALPKLKFFGDLGLHGRKHLVRKDDLDKLHVEIRVSLEDLASHLPAA